MFGKRTGSSIGELSEKGRFWNQIPVFLYSEMWSMGQKVIAKGSVVILGRLEGSVHAGACGDDKAYVAALSMKPAYMRIGDVKAGRSLLAICRQSF